MGGEAAQIARAIARGLTQIALAIENGLQALARAIDSHALGHVPKTERGAMSVPTRATGERYRRRRKLQ